jgi:hypothetical protein
MRCLGRIEAYLPHLSAMGDQRNLYFLVYIHLGVAMLYP